MMQDVIAQARNDYREASAFVYTTRRFGGLNETERAKARRDAAVDVLFALGGRP